MKHKIIAIICAMDVELEGFKKELKNQSVEKVLNYDFIIGDYESNKLVITKCGIGKVNASICATLMIEHYKPDLLINSGIAGGVSRKLSPLDLVIATSVVYSDVDMTSDAFSTVRYGQLQDMPFEYKASCNVLDNLRNIALDNNVYFGNIMSGDQFVTDYNKVKRIVDDHFGDLDILACDMESCAIAHTCYLTKVPFLIVRSISDIVGSSNGFDYETFAPKASKNATDLVHYIIKEIN